MQCYEGTEMVGKQNGRILITIIICIASWSVSIYRLYSVVMFVGAKAVFHITVVDQYSLWCNTLYLFALHTQGEANPNFVWLCT